MIDWGDVHEGDVACDLMVALAFLPQDARPVFEAAYGAIDEITWRRTRFRTIHHSAAVAHYGKESATRISCARGCARCGSSLPYRSDTVFTPPHELATRRCV